MVEQQSSCIVRQNSLLLPVNALLSVGPSIASKGNYLLEYRIILCSGLDFREPAVGKSIRRINIATEMAKEH